MPSILMTENKEIEILFKNLQDGLKNHSVKELNHALVSALNNKEDKQDEITYVLHLVCKTYDIGTKSLKSNYMRGKVQDAKQMCYCLLHFNLGLSIRYISKRIFFNWPTSVLLGIKRYKTANLNIKHEREFVETYEILRKSFLEYITIKNNKE